MKKDNLHDKNITKNCDVCGHAILIDQLGFGSCTNCGWHNSDVAAKKTDYPFIGNFLSMNNAKKLYNEGKTLNPNFDEFFEFVRVYGEVQFTYNSKVYGVIRDDKIEFFCDEIENSNKVYTSYEDFKQRADIDGLLLKNIWNLVEKIDYLQ